MSEPHSSGPGHETQDVNFDAIFGLAGLAVVLSVAIGLGVWMLFHDMRERQRGRMPKPSPLALEQKGRLPPQPQLEGIERMTVPWGSPLRRESAAPDSYEWVDRKGGVVRIPIDRTMAIIVEQKLIPSAPKSTIRDFRDPYVALPSPANSGRSAPKEQP